MESCAELDRVREQHNDMRDLPPCNELESGLCVVHRYWPDDWAASPLFMGVHVSDFLTKINEPGYSCDFR